MLRKDNLLDENAPEENKTAEEIAEELQQSVRIVQTRYAHVRRNATESFDLIFWRNGGIFVDCDELQKNFFREIFPVPVFPTDFQNFEVLPLHSRYMRLVKQ